MTRSNEFGQPIGADLGAWKSAEFPSGKSLIGAHTALHRLDADAHATPLFSAFEGAPGSLWTYLPYGPFESVDEIASLINFFNEQPDWQPYAIVVENVVLGFASYIRIDSSGGAIEIGAITLSPTLQRTTAATEAIHLMITESFALGFRRCEWKCDDLNAPSRAAAERFGFTYEGTFRNATHYKGRSRDTAWFAITSDEWPRLNSSFEAWLDPANFDQAGRQRLSLRQMRG